MTQYHHIKTLRDEEFRRLTGVKRTTFEQMILLLVEAEKVQKIKSGKPHKLCIEDRLLLKLEYLREYRTYFHIANSYGIHETMAIRISRWVEDVLVKSKEFALPCRKALFKSDMEYKVILVDAAESPCERPKKEGLKRKARKIHLQKRIRKITARLHVRELGTNMLLDL